MAVPIVSIFIIAGALLIYCGGKQSSNGMAAKASTVPDGTYVCLAQGDDLLGRKVMVIKMDGEEPRTLLVGKLPETKVVSVIISGPVVSIYRVDGAKTVGPEPLN